jgi:predicted transcriptional regulator
MPPTKQPVPLSADNPDNLYLYVDHTGEPLVDHTGEPLSKKRFARIPAEVLSDQRLKSVDIHVYGALAEAHWTNSATVGTRWLAKRANRSRRLVIESLKRLATSGHIQKAPTRRGERSRYVLTSAVFKQASSEKKNQLDCMATTPISRKNARLALIPLPKSARREQNDLPSKRSKR